MTPYCDPSCFGGGSRAFPGSKALQACLLMMTFLASPSKAFLPALSSASAVVRHNLRLATSTSTSTSTRYSPRNDSNDVARQPNKASWRSLASLYATTDGAKDAAMAAVQAAEEALDRAAEDAGAAAAGGDAREVQDTVAAARAAARNAMESLRRDSRGLGGMRVADAEEAFRFRQDAVTSPARSAVQAALSAVAGAQTAAPAATAVSSTAAQDAIGMVQAALGRRDSAAAEDGGVVTSEVAPLAAATADSPSPLDDDRGCAGNDARSPGGDGSDEMQSKKEPESAVWSRHNPAASHRHMAHLLWRQVAGPGDTVLDCTAGNGHDSLALGKAVALKDGLGSLYVMDVQERALEATRERLRSELGELALKRSTLINGNFREMPPELEPESVQLVVYNLGWLPGGDKSITTKLEDTLESIEAAKPLVKHGGMISVMLYKGHAEGERETDAVLGYAAGLALNQWRVFTHERINRPDSPQLLTMYKL
ncbi:unnamed protein product [Pylaiella littoralis]